MSEAWIPLGRLDEIPDKSVRRFKIDFRSGWLVRNGDSIKAYLNHCTHAGGSLHREGEKFRCERHGATFDIASGKPLSGPAIDGAPLSTLEIKIEEGMVYYKRVLSDE